MVLAVETSGLEKNYNGVQALDGVDIAVKDGEFFGLLGPNGAGKTTFINVLVGLVEKTGGEARVFGFDVEEDYRQVHSRIGLSPQEFNVDRFFPIKEVLVHTAGYHGIPLREAQQKAEEMLATVGLEDKKDTRFSFLSSGMKRRFLLARAMITAPDLLILDEPTAGVDVRLRHELWDLIREMNAEGTTIFLTTHYIEEAEQLCDRVTILNEGRVVTDASPAELMQTGTDTISLRLAETPETLPELENETVEAVRLDGDRVEVEVRSSGKNAPAILTELADRGYEVIDMRVHRASLEDVFIEVTGGEE